MVKKGTSVKEISNKLISDITKVFVSDVKTTVSNAAKENPRVAKLEDKYEFKLLDINDFGDKQLEYMNSIEKLHKELTDEKAAEKAAADKKAAAEKAAADKKAADEKAAANKKARKEAFLQKCKDYQHEFPAFKIADHCNVDDDRIWAHLRGVSVVYDKIKLPEGAKMYDWLGNESAVWNGNELIQSDNDVEALRNFLNTGWKSESPAHPMALANICKILIDTKVQRRRILAAEDFKKLHDLCLTWIGKAETIEKEYPEYKLKIKEKKE